MTDEFVKELKQEDKIEFPREGNQTYKVGNIAVRDFNNKIWRNGFMYGMMTGGAIILVVIAAIVSIPNL